MQQNISLRAKFRQYSQKAIFNIMPSQFVGVAKEYASVKKQRVNSQQIFNVYYHEVSSIQKMSNNLEKSLNKKRKQLKYAQAVRNRYISELRQKQKINELKQIQLEKLRNKTLEEKYQSQLRRSRAKERFMYNKKDQYNRTKNELTNLRYQRMMDQSSAFEKNQSRVKQIEEDKARIKDYYNKFFQTKNKKYMQSYKDLIQKQKKSDKKYKIQTKNLQIKLLLLKQNANKKQQELDLLNSSVESLKQSRSLRSSRHYHSTRSMTPFQILSGSDNPEKLAFNK